MNIAEIQNLPKGTPVTKLNVTVVRAFKPRSGTNANGDYTVMDMEIQDASGTMKAQWWNPQVEQSGDVQGREIEISAYRNDKGRWVGASVDEHTYNNETTMRVKVNGGCCAILGAGGEAAPAPRQQAPAQGRVQAVPATPPAFVPSSAAKPMSAKALMAQLRNVILEMNGLKLPGEAVGALASTFAIAMTQGKLEPDLDDPGDLIPDWDA